MSLNAGHVTLLFVPFSNAYVPFKWIQINNIVPSNWVLTQPVKSNIFLHLRPTTLFIFPFIFRLFVVVIGASAAAPATYFPLCMVVPYLPRLFAKLSHRRFSHYPQNMPLLECVLWVKRKKTRLEKWFNMKRMIRKIIQNDSNGGAQCHFVE